MTMRGGKREGSGRKPKGRNKVLSVRITQEAFDKLETITKEKSAFIETLIMEYKG